MRFVKVDGKGDPNTAADYAAGVGWLYSISYGMKFASKAQLLRTATEKLKTIIRQPVRQKTP